MEVSPLTGRPRTLLNAPRRATVYYLEAPGAGVPAQCVDLQDVPTSQYRLQQLFQLTVTASGSDKRSASIESGIVSGDTARSGSKVRASSVLHRRGCVCGAAPSASTPAMPLYLGPRVVWSWLSKISSRRFACSLVWSRCASNWAASCALAELLKYFSAVCYERFPGNYNHRGGMNFLAGSFARIPFA
jgi:hypothetical protein